MKLALMIPTLCRADLLREAVEPLLRHRELFSQFTVLDNGNQGLGWVLDAGIGLYKSPRNLGFGGSCNWAIQRMLVDCNADWLMVHSDDIVLSDETLSRLPEICDRHRDAWLVRGKASFAVFMLSCAGAEVSRYEPGKYFDEEFWPGQFEDLDFEWRLKLLDENRVVTREPDLFPAVWRRQSSYGGVSDFRSYRRKNRAYFVEKWGAIRPSCRYRVPFNGEQPWPNTA